MAGSLAREFMQKFPDDPRVQDAKKIELSSLLNQQRASGAKLQPLEDAEIDSYIKNPLIPAKDRYDISALAKSVRVDRTKIKNAADSRAVHASHARELIQEFPEDARGYGYLLAVAKSMPADSAIEAASDLLASNVPERLKKAANSLLRQKSMEGKKLQIDGLDIDAFKGSPVVIYTWSRQRPDIFQFIKHRCILPGVKLIGINMDPDVDVAKQIAHAVRLPGEQYYDSGGMEGPLVSQLHIQAVVSVYIVDAEGRLFDTRGYENTKEKLEALLRAAGPLGQSTTTDEEETQ